MREIYIHFIWTTKNRQPILRGRLELFAHRKFQEIAEDEGLSVLAANSAWTHLHLLAAWNTTTTFQEMVRDWKSVVSKVWNERSDTDIELEWQSGAGIFSISRHEVDRLVNYIANQKRHHRDETTIHRYEQGYGPSKLTGS